MNETKENVVTVDNFNVICRVCLRADEDMVDIFRSGMDNQIMEVTNLKVKSDDKLPKTLCQTCRQQIEQLFKFLKQAKSSDTYLRSLLISKANKEQKPEDKTPRRMPFRKRLKTWSRKTKSRKNVKDELEKDKMYLIFVPKTEESDLKGDSEICIKDLNYDNENLELTHYCRTLVKNHFSDHTYPKELRVSDHCQTELHRAYTVKLDLFKCNENNSDLSKQSSSLLLDYSYKCPICGLTESKTNYVSHLLTHREEDLSVAINRAPKPLEQPEHISSDIKVSRINLSCLNCTICGKHIESKDAISEHLKSCLPNKKFDIDYSIKYSCPVCHISFVDEEEIFIKHLGTHQNENVYFVSVDKTRQDVKSEYSKPFEVKEINSCDKCEWEAESFESLNNHYSVVHSEDTPSNEISLSCPVCQKEWNMDSVDENKSKLYEHLRVHKSEGMNFIKVKKNGNCSEVPLAYSDVFTQSLLDDQVYSPELIISHRENYTCDLCQKQFRRKQEVIKHLKWHQTSRENSNYICEKCGKRCTGKLTYKKHFLKHSKAVPSSSKRATCTICSKMFANRTTLSGHMRQHLREGVGNDTSLLGMICEKCGKSFSNNASLAKHKRLHSTDKENTALKCEICDRDFYRQSSFDRHKSAHMNPKYFECDVCKLPLSSVISLQKHSEVHRNGSNTFDCKACKISFLTKDSLTAHQSHTGHYQDRKPLECNVCHEKFFIGRKFTEHIKTHPKYKMGECTLCGKRLSTSQSLMLHMGRHFESNSILCPHCGKQFFEERNYHRHLLTHEGIKPFPCDVENCKKSFYTLFELNRHKKYHNNTRDFRCPYCSKSFHEANHLTVHVRTHTGERPYTCPHCNKGFVTRTRCKHHIKLVHQGVGYDLIRSSISKKVTVFEPIEAI